MARVILISGPVDAGKSTAACNLVSLLPGQVFCIEGGTFWSFIKKPEKLDRRESFKEIRSFGRARLVEP
jgi:adenylate kinase family enzyme